VANRPSSGTVLSDRYELSDQLGAGGMAEVFLGRDRVLGRTVAVKTLHRQYATDPSFIERFRREAQSAAALNHPHVVGVYDTGSDDGTYYIVMEYVEGNTLRDQIRAEGPLLPERAAEIAAEVCEGLDYAHSRGIIHRDVKPANIMITPNGGVKVADFGIARAVSGDTVTQTAMVLGTAQYFSPEQAQSGPIDARSDIYSLGIVLYEMLTRQVPFTGSSPVAIAYKHVKEDPILPSRLNPDVPPELEAIAMKALSKNPKNRYQSAEEMRQDLLRALHGRPVEATPVLADATGIIDPIGDETVVVERRGGPSTSPQPPTRYRTEQEKRRRTGIILLSGIVVAILGIALWALIGILSQTKTLTVPEVLGLNITEAQQTLRDRGFQVEVLDPVFSDEYAEGEIAEQDPPPGKTIEEGGTVRIAPSKGTELVEVPNVEGKSQGEAERLIEGAGLELGDVSRRADASVREGFVISQEPSADTFVKTGTKVDLVVSSGPPTTIVPDVVGRTKGDARFILENAGFKVQTKEQEQSPECAEPDGRVCRQSPGAGEEVQEGSTVTIFVALAVEPTPSPTPTLPECSDGIDNDGDGGTDFGGPTPDEQCTAADDDDEST